MFRSTTVAVEPANQSGPDLVQNWADVHAGSTAATGTSEQLLLKKKSFCIVYEGVFAFADGDITDIDGD